MNMRPTALEWMMTDDLLRDFATLRDKGFSNTQSALCKLGDLTSVRAIMDEAKTKDAYDIMRNDIITAYAMFLFGRKVFRLSRNLCAQFIETDFSIDFKDLHLPFEAFTISVDLPGVGLLGEKVDGLNLNSLSVFAWRGMLMNRRGMSYSSRSSITITADSIPNPRNGYRDQLSAVIDLDGYKESSKINLETISHQFTSKRDSNFDLVMRLAFNTILYVTSYGADLVDRSAPNAAEMAALRKCSSSKKRAKIERRLADLSRFPYVAVGGSIQLPSAAREDHGGVGHKLVNRHVVRGHWRWQVCGEGRTERRHIWIRPYIKGPDGAPVISRGYMVADASARSNEIVDEAEAEA